MNETLTAVLIARNAEATIAECVRALRFCDRILVGENNSLDRTAELARGAGAEVRTVEWQGYGPTKNALLGFVDQGWILSVDADEMVSPGLAKEIRQAIAQAGERKGYWISRRNFFLGREIRHGGWSPDWQLRLFCARSGRFEEKAVHEALRVDGPLGRLAERLDHFSYRSLDDYFLRMNRYTTLAVAEREQRGKTFSWLRLLFDPWWTFVKMYVFKNGWRDGFPGLVLSLLSSLNTLVKHAKQWEQYQIRKS